MIRKALITSTIIGFILNEKNEPVEVRRTLTGKKISRSFAIKIMREEFGTNILIKDIEEEIATYECSIDKFLEIAIKIEEKVEE